MPKNTSSTKLNLVRSFMRTHPVQELYEVGEEQRQWRRETLPGTDAQHGLGGDADAVIRVDVVHAVHPGVGVLNVDEPPGERAGDDDIQSAAGGEAKAVAGDLRGPITALGIVRQGAVAVVPCGQKPVL